MCVDENFTYIRVSMSCHLSMIAYTMLGIISIYILSLSLSLSLTHTQTQKHLTSFTNHNCIVTTEKTHFDGNTT